MEELETITEELRSGIHSTRFLTVEEDEQSHELPFVPILLERDGVVGSVVNGRDLFEGRITADEELTVRAKQGDVTYDINKIEDNNANR